MPNKFKAVWVSHSSLGDFKKCPRAYYLRNVYKNSNNRKISIVSPYLSLGVAVHDCLEPLAWIPAKNRFDEDLISKFNELINSFSGKKGGFKDQEQFQSFKEKGIAMLQNIIKNPGPIAKPAVRMIQDKSELPWMWLSEEEEIILSGKTDWLEYNNGNLSVYDFKTGKSVEKDDSLQLPIYSLLVKHYKRYPLTKAFYWYIAQEASPTEKKLPDYKTAYELVLKEALKLAEARKSNNVKCPYSGCRNCDPYEKILNGEGEKLGVGSYGQELYYI